MFMPRLKSDRPLPVPPNSRNLGFISQFVEIPDEVVFTVEHSVRAAQMAVYQLLGINRSIPPITRHDSSISVLIHTLEKALHDRRMHTRIPRSGVIGSGSRGRPEYSKTGGGLSRFTFDVWLGRRLFRTDQQRRVERLMQIKPLYRIVVTIGRRLSGGTLNKSARAQRCGRNNLTSRASI